jgi:hypothetical protein
VVIVGIDARLEDQGGRIVAELQDASGYLNWLLSLIAHEANGCARFIDPYGQTVFNRLQIDQLKAELEELRDHITDEALVASKRQYLRSFDHLRPDVLREATQNAERVSTATLIEHLRKLLALISAAKAAGPHHYLRFVGD